MFGYVMHSSLSIIVMSFAAVFRGPTIAGGYNQAALCANLVVGCSTPLRVSSNPLEDPANTLSIRIGGKTTSFWREHSTSTGAAPPVLKLNNPPHTLASNTHDTTPSGCTSRVVLDTVEWADVFCAGVRWVAGPWALAYETLAYPGKLQGETV